MTMTFGRELTETSNFQVDYTAIEKEIISDLSSQIISYDFGNKIQHEIEKQVGQVALPSTQLGGNLDQSLDAMLTLLTSEETVKEIFGATQTELEYAQNLNVNFNAIDKTVTVSSVAQNAAGQPFLKYTVNTEDMTIKNTEIADNNQPEGEVAQYEHVTETTENNNEEQTSNPATTVVVDTNIDSSLPNQLTPEELERQKEIAFKVVFFFIGFICFTFFLLYLYHRMVQNSLNADQEKQTFFDFLAGQIDEDYPSSLGTHGMIR